MFLFDLIHSASVNNFQFCRDGSSWVELCFDCINLYVKSISLNWVIKSPKRDLLYLLRFFLFIIILRPFLPLLPFLLFLAAQILSRRVLSNHWMDFYKIWGCGRYGCEVVQVGFKIQNVGL